MTGAAHRAKPASHRDVLAARIGHVPGVALAAALGLLAVSFAGVAARDQQDWSSALWWLGIGLIVIPACAGVTARRASDRERMLLLVLVGAALYMVKVFTAPLGFTFPDEFSHLRSLDDLLRTGRLFAENPLLPVASGYPGLPALTASVATSTDGSSFSAGVLVIGAARIVQVLALFGIFRIVTSSSRIAGLATLLYAANPSFLIFQAHFAYESLALPLATLALWCVLHIQRVQGQRGLLCVIGSLAIAAVAVTHHLTSLALLAFLAGWCMLELMTRNRSGLRWPVVAALLWAIAVNAVWLLLVAGPAVPYLAEIVSGGVLELLETISGEGAPRPAFAGRQGAHVPVAEIAVGYASVLVLCIGLLFGGPHVLRRHRGDPVVLMLLAAATLYPVSLALRLTGAGAETAQRASEFVFLGMGYVLADTALHRRMGRVYSVRHLLIPAVIVIFAGGIVVGVPVIARLPGPYLPAAEQRSVDRESRELAEWARSALGPGQRFIADRTNAKLLASLGGQYPVTQFNSGVPTAYVMFSSELGEEEKGLLREGRIQYIVADLRLTRDPPLFPVFFEEAEPNAGRHTMPFPVSGFEKFDELSEASRIYDSGSIVVYDVSRLSAAP